MHKASAPSATRSATRPRVALGLVVGVVTALLLTAILSIDLLPRVYEVRDGNVAAVAIKAPSRISFISQFRTRAARDAAAAQVPPVVELDRDRIVQQTRGLADLLQAINGVRNDQTKRTVEERAAAIAALTSPPLSEATARRLAELDEFRWATLTNEGQRVLQDVLRDRIPEERVQEVRQ